MSTLNNCGKRLLVQGTETAGTGIRAALAATSNSDNVKSTSKETNTVAQTALRRAAPELQPRVRMIKPVLFQSHKPIKEIIKEASIEPTVGHQSIRHQSSLARIRRFYSEREKTTKPPIDNLFHGTTLKRFPGLKQDAIFTAKSDGLFVATKGQAADYATGATSSMNRKEEKPTLNDQSVVFKICNPDGTSIKNLEFVNAGSGWWRIPPGMQFKVAEVIYLNK